MQKRQQIFGYLISFLTFASPLINWRVFILPTTLLVHSTQKEVLAETAEFYFNRGVKKNDAGDYSEAIADFNKSIQLNPYISIEELQNLEMVISKVL